MFFFLVTVGLIPPLDFGVFKLDMKPLVVPLLFDGFRIWMVKDRPGGHPQGIGSCFFLCYRNTNSMFMLFSAQAPHTETHIRCPCRFLCATILVTLCVSLVFSQYFFSSFVGWFLDLHAKGEYIFIVMGTKKRPRISSKRFDGNK